MTYPGQIKITVIRRQGPLITLNKTDNIANNTLFLLYLENTEKLNECLG